MAVIKLTHNDINEMVSRTVRSVLNESMKEVMGSIMAEKDDVIEHIVEWVEEEWEKIKKYNVKPNDSGTFTYNNPENGVRFTGQLDDYILLLPNELARQLEISEDYEFNVGIRNYIIPEDKEKYFGGAERGTDGTSYAQPKYNEFIRATGKRKLSRVDFEVPAINGELQLQGFYSTIYHELNHDASRLSLQSKHQENMSDEDLMGMHFFSASRRKDDPPHFRTARVLHPPRNDFWALEALFGPSDSPEQKRAKEEMSYVFYGVWEITERNARAEAIYGDLQAMKAKREEFRELYPKTELYRVIGEIENNLKHLEEVPTFGYGVDVWRYAAQVMSMYPRGKNQGVMTIDQIRRYLGTVKERFMSRSKELIGKMYRKAMKVAELYFQRQEQKVQDAKDRPGGGMEKLGQLIGGE